MDNLPVVFSQRTIDKEIKPFVYEDIKGKSNEEIQSLLNFYINNCLNHKITNTSYNYSHSRACITVICYFKNLEIPSEVAMNDIDRVTNQDQYYNPKLIKKPTGKKEPKVKSAAACRITVEPETIWVTKEVIKPTFNVHDLIKFHEAKNSRSD